MRTPKPETVWVVIAEHHRTSPSGRHSVDSDVLLEEGFYADVEEAIARSVTLNEPLRGQFEAHRERAAHNADLVVARRRRLLRESRLLWRTRARRDMPEIEPAPAPVKTFEQFLSHLASAGGYTSFTVAMLERADGAGCEMSELPA